MKRKIALLLALAMTASMLPVNAFASSSNKVNKVISVKDEDEVEGVYLKITPTEEVETGDTIVLNFENTKVFPSSYFEESNFDEDAKNFAVLQGNSSATNTYAALYKQVTNGTKPANVLKNLWGTNGGNLDDIYIPWRISRTGKQEMNVELFPIPGSMADVTYSSMNKPYYYIPLAVYADGEGTMTVTIDSNETSISSTTITFANSTSDSGATTTTVDDVLDFNESLLFSDDNGNAIRIKETVSGTFESGTLTIRVNGGFEFNTSSSNPVVTAGTNSPSVHQGTSQVDDDKITIVLTFDEPTTRASSIIITGIVVEPEDEDDDWGEVKFTFKGIGMTSETVTVANRADYGMTMTLEEDPTTILTGLSYDVNPDLDEDDFVTAEVHLEETIADTWNTKQKMYLKLPDMVKIVDFEVNDTKYIKGSNIEDLAYVDDDGATLVIPRLNDQVDENGNSVDVVNEDECSEFDIKFYVTIDPAFGDNDITLSVYGAGVDEGVIADKVVAKAVTPISISTETTKTNIGYSSIATADVTITEAIAGALLDDQDLLVYIDTNWTSGDIGIDDSDIEVEANGGELAVKAYKTKTVDNQQYLEIPVDKQSYTTPGSITITGINVGTSRSVPYGDYDLKVAGGAVLNNYDEDYEDNYKTSTTVASSSFSRTDEKNEFVWTQDNTDSYKYDAYLSVITQTETLDEVVSVTIGETTIYINDEAYTMEVAPYIQASSASTMVPLRFVTLALGVDTDAITSGNADETSTVTWDANTKTATIFYAAGSGQKIIQFTAGSNIMVVDGTSVPMDNGVVAEITDSRMFVPFRALGTALGVPVSWDETTRTATYNAK